MNCRLCGKEGPLRNSHIFSEWIYAGIYDEKGRLNVPSTLEKQPRPYEQKGYRELLLCDECEQQFGRYENYARGIIKGGQFFDVERQEDCLHISGIDYQKFKLFQLSILWRAGVSSLLMFDRVNLGMHESCLQRMLRDENPGRQSDYPCVLFGLKSEAGRVPEFIDQPTVVRIENIRCYRFIFCGLMWVFFVSSHNPNRVLCQQAVSEDGVLTVWLAKFEDLGYLMAFMNEVDKMGRLPR